LTKCVKIFDSEFELNWLLTNFENKKLKENEAKAGIQCLVQILWLKPTAIKRRRRTQKLKVVGENIYCRRFQPTEQRTRLNEMALATYFLKDDQRKTTHS
jgi:hypothetical protein